MASYMTDVGNVIDKSSAYPELKNSTSRKRDPSSLDMTDFLNLMVVQLQNQSIDSSMDTSDMLNQMVQMQMITALTNMTDASVMTYASSLVGKEVTIGVWDNGVLEEKVVTITGTGLSNGQQVLFAGDEIYDLSSVMAVGRLPGNAEEDDKPDKVEGSDKTEGGDKTEGSDKTEGTGGTEGTGSSGSTGSTEGADNSGSTGSTEGANNSGSTGSSGAADSTGSTTQTGTEQTGTSSRQLSDTEVEGLKDFIRSSGTEVAEDISNGELVDLINGILKSGGDSAKALENYLKGSQVQLPENYTETDLIQALAQLLSAQQVLNPTSTAQQNTQARRVQEVVLEEFT